MFRQSMTLSPISKAETTPPLPSSPPPPLVATSSPAKTQPLHTFPLSDLKWSMNHSASHRLLKSSEKSHVREAAEARKPNLLNEKALTGGSAPLSPVANLEKMKSSSSSAAAVSDRAVDRSEKHKSMSVDGRSKILIRLPQKKSKDSVASTAAAAAAADSSGGVAADARNQISGGGTATEVEEFATKMWNLRPRKPPSKPSGSGCGSRGGGVGQRTSRPDLPPPRSCTNPKNAAENKEKKPKLRISLSRSEIDEDILAMTGAKPSRRPKKRSKQVQKQLDNLFPGLWLGNVTPDTYKVSDHSTKG